MIILSAPFEQPQTTIYLPSPTFNDNLSVGLAINEKVGLNGTLYTYVKRKGTKKLNYTFSMPFEKYLEVKAFLQVYVMTNMRLTNHLNEVWNVKTTTDEFTYGFKTRDERFEFQILFQGVRIYAPVTQC